MKKDGKVISFINMKGGVGKTTLCIGIGDYLASYCDKKILFIDLDRSLIQRKVWLMNLI